MNTSGLEKAKPLQRRPATQSIIRNPRRTYTDQSGQVLAWLAVLIIPIFFGMAALVLDIGRGVLAYQKLQSATDAAALAAAQMMPTATSQQSVINAATAFSAVSGDANANAGLMPGAKMVSGYPKLECLSTVSNWGIVCPSAINANAIQVSETVSIPTIFAAVLGFHNLTVTTTSTAAMRGSPRNPYNVAIVIDTTGSMGTQDNVASSCMGTRISCSLEGVRTLLGNLSPCASGSSCGTATNGNVSSPLDEVAIYTFPGMVNAQDVTNDVTCSSTSLGSVSSGAEWGSSQRSSSGWGGGGGGTNVKYANYIFSNPAGSAPIFQLVNFSSDYATANPSSNHNTSASSSSLLNTSSNAVESVGGKSGCSGIAYGGGTYYASAIYQAQADLVAQQQARLPLRTQNVMIILSDGDATAGEYYTGGTTDDLQIYGDTQTQEQTTLLNTAGTYPSAFNQCEQGVVAAQAATAAGTTVYTVAYGTQASGCKTDQSGFSITIGANRYGYGGTTYKNTNPNNMTPCQAMQNMASRSSTFYSDYSAAGNGSNNDSSCQGASQSDTKLDDIFAAIAGNLSTARLIPNSTQ
jgi:Flp pilus assembly protein TadG